MYDNEVVLKVKAKTNDDEIIEYEFGQYVTVQTLCDVFVEDDAKPMELVFEVIS